MITVKADEIKRTWTVNEWVDGMDSKQVKASILLLERHGYYVNTNLKKKDKNTWEGVTIHITNPNNVTNIIADKRLGKYLCDIRKRILGNMECVKEKR